LVGEACSLDVANGAASRPPEAIDSRVKNQASPQDGAPLDARIGVKIEILLVREALSVVRPTFRIGVVIGNVPR
jgi:hypothetical protein